MRNNEFLQTRLNQIWELLFPDTPKANDVKVLFKGRWRNKFGHIVKIGKDTEIAINGYSLNNSGVLTGLSTISS